MAIAVPLDHTRKRQVKAGWSNGKVTLRDLLPWNRCLTALHSDVDGLEVIIAGQVSS